MKAIVIAMALLLSHGGEMPREGSGVVACHTFTDLVYNWSTDQLDYVNGYKMRCRESTMRAKRKGLG